MIRRDFEPSFFRDSNGTGFTWIRNCNRFEPWPEWLVLGEKCLNFMNEEELEDRRQSFSKLLNTPHGIHPLLSDEKERLMAEYVT